MLSAAAKNPGPLDEEALAELACLQAQRLNERLPRISASGREVRAFCQQGLRLLGTRTVVAEQDALAARVGSFATAMRDSQRACDALCSLA